MKRLNGMDAMLLYSETPNLHTHTLKVAVIDAAEFDGDFTFDVFRRTIQRRLHLLDPLRYRLVDIPWKLHHPMWMENCEVDLDYHLRRVHVPAPAADVNSTRSSARSPAHRWTATAHCGSSTSPREWPTTASRSSARCTTPWPTVSRRPTSLPG